MSGIIRLKRCATLAGLFIVSLTTCRREAPPNPSSGDSPHAPEQRKTELVVFPEALHVPDASVNDFVGAALAQCAAGDYDAFRRRWTARQEPLPKSEFDEGWQAVQRINVRALEKVMLAADSEQGRTEPETVYALFVEVSLDPTQRAGQRVPNRDIVLMLSREHDEWRLARAPKSMREWIRKRVDESTVPADNQVPLGDTNSPKAGADPSHGS